MLDPYFKIESSKMSMQVSEYDSDDNDSYGNNGVNEERVSWRMDTQSSPDKYMCMQGQMNHHQPPPTHHHHMQSPSGGHRMGGQFQPQYFSQSQTPPMHQYGHVPHQQQPPQKPRQMGSGYMVEPMQGEMGGRCDVPPSNKGSAVPSPSVGNVTPKPSQHQFVMGTVKRRGRPPKPESEKKAKKEPKPRGRPPRNSLLQVAIGNKKHSSASTPNSNLDSSSLQESPFPLLPSAYTSLNNTDSGKKSRGRPRIHPQKDPGIKRPRGRPRVTPLVGEAAWKAECGKLRRNLKKKDEIVAALKAKLVELGQPVDEIIAQARNNRDQAGNSADEDEEQNGASAGAPAEGTSVEDPQQKYRHGYYAGGDDSRNNGNNQPASGHQRGDRPGGDCDDDDDDDEEDDEEEEVEEVNISSNASMSNNPHQTNDNDEEDDDEEDEEDDDDDGSRGFD